MLKFVIVQIALVSSTPKQFPSVLQNKMWLCTVNKEKTIRNNLSLVFVGAGGGGGICPPLFYHAIDKIPSNNNVNLLNIMIIPFAQTKS